MSTITPSKCCAVLAAFFVSVILLLAAAAPSRAGEPVYAPGEVLVKFKSGVSKAEITKLNKKVGADIIRRFRLVDAYHLRLAHGVTVKDAIARYSKSPIVEYAEPNYQVRASVTYPNDTYFSNLWGLNNTGQTGGTPDADIDAPEAWDITTGDPNGVIAVIDTGVDYNHEDLAGNIWVNPGEDLNGNGAVDPGDINGVDDDGNGYVDDLVGWDWANNDNDPFDDNGHGTHVSGTIAGNGNNALGVTGVNWKAKIMALKFLDASGSGWTSDAVLAIEYYTDKGVKVSNNSWGGGGYSQTLYNAIQASKSVFVAAAGNYGLNNDKFPHYPSSYNLDNIIAVAATDDTDTRAWFSNYGNKSVDLAAPGVGILSSVPGNSYAWYDGTSMATPHVTGVAGLLLAQAPNLTVNEIKWRILKGTDPKGLPVLTGGRLNAFNSLGYGLAPADVSVTVTPLGPTTVTPGGTITYNVALTNNTTSVQTVKAKVFVQFPDGSTKDLDGPSTFTIPAGGSINKDFTKTVPAGTVPGTYTIFGQAISSTSFDEDPAVYQVVP